MVTEMQFPSEGRKIRDQKIEKEKLWGLIQKDACSSDELDQKFEEEKISNEHHRVLIQKLNRRNESLIKTLKAREGRDPLTGLFNRTFLNQKLEKLITELSVLDDKRAPSKQAVIVVKFDLKGFKEINDTQGHDAGDEALRNFADLLNTKVAARGNDLVFRPGGDEFTAILSIEDVPDEEIKLAIDNLIKRIENDVNEFAYMGYSVLTQTESLKEDEVSSKAKELLKKADLMQVKDRAEELAGVK